MLIQQLHKLLANFVILVKDLKYKLMQAEINIVLKPNAKKTNILMRLLLSARIVITTVKLAADQTMINVLNVQRIEEIMVNQ